MLDHHLTVLPAHPVFIL